MGMDVLSDLRSYNVNFTEDQVPQRLMLCWNDNHFELETFSKERAIAFLEEGKAVIPLWLNEIDQKLQEKL